MSEARGLIPASTILLVRDAPELEVLMVERHHQIDFASGALVFPGGKTAAEDSDPRWADLCDGDLSDEERIFRIAAIREAFEESGMLLARALGRRGSGAPIADPDAVAPVFAQRAEIAAGKASFLAAVQESALALALDTLVPYAHWITPAMMPKRFDTRFYIALAPGAQEAMCDGAETVDACWIAPQAALAAAAEGRRKIIFPTRLNVELLTQWRSAETALDAARTRRIVTVTPEVVREPEGQFLVIPAEAGYSVTRESLEGNRP
jgi:8-oxo-dGTP pyrophosphatase MutT (NUDIX family)